MTIKAWIEAVRLRTLPVSLAGVALGAAYGVCYPVAKVLPAVLCLVFATLAQIASNFANEYYDYAGGLDRPGREGPRRGVTEGDITPKAMLAATYLTLALACCVGCVLLLWGGWWLLAVGVFIAVGVTAYSAGPYPLSHHALGEVAVVVFYGLIPVTLTCYLMSGHLSLYAAVGGIGAGLMGANVLIVNNYRDRSDDESVGKHTLAVVLGYSAVRRIYLLNGVAAIIAFVPLWLHRAAISGTVISVVYLLLHLMLWRRMAKVEGAALNPVLGATAMLMSAYAVAMLIAVGIQ